MQWLWVDFRFVLNFHVLDMPQERSREECEHIIASATDGWEEYMNFDICTEF